MVIFEFWYDQVKRKKKQNYTTWYQTNSQIKFKITKLMSSLCDYSKFHVLIKKENSLKDWSSNSVK